MVYQSFQLFNPGFPHIFNNYFPYLFNTKLTDFNTIF